MAANTEHSAKGGARLYVMVWVWLLVLTVIEVVLAYEHLFPIKLMLIVLMALSIVKAALIMAYFMHLKFERLNLVLTLIPAMVIVISLLAIFFPDSMRLFEMRPK